MVKSTTMGRATPVLLALLGLVTLLSSFIAVDAQSAAMEFNITQVTSMWPRTKAGITVTTRAFQYDSYLLPAGGYISWAGSGDGFNDTVGADNNNDVWVSPDGASWTCVSGRYRTSSTAEWTNCPNANNGLQFTVGATSCADTQGNLYVIGGEYNVPGNQRRQTHNTVYISSNGGLSWTVRTDTGLPRRSYANCIMSSSKIYVLNGVLDYEDAEGDWRNPGNDIWSSSLGLSPAFALVGNGGYAPRAASMATSVVDNSMYHYDRIFYVLGGWSDFTNSSLNNDVYYSTDLGVTWSQATSRAAWTPRADGELIATPRGFLALVAGRSLVGNNEWNTLNDIYLSADGGLSWYLRQGGFSARVFPSVTTSADKARLVVAFGRATGNQQDVLISHLQLDDETAVTMRYFGMRPNQVTSSCIGLFACKNELAFTPKTTSAPWSARSHHSVHMARDGSLRLFGGLPATTSANVWSSTNNGQSWTSVSTTMPARVGACVHADASDNLFITGGYVDGDSMQLSNVTFVSTNGGTQWDETTNTNSAYPMRSWHNCLSDSAGNTYVVNGYGVGAVLNDVYMSSDHGATWSFVSTGAYRARAGSSIAVWRKGTARNFDVIYMLGGTSAFDAMPFDDVFYSTDGMKTWMLASEDAPWPARQDGALSIASNGMLVLSGGLQTLSGVRYYFNDVWVSLNGGADWAVIEDAVYSTRAFGVALHLADDTMAMFGGYGSVYSASGDLTFVDYKDVWVSTTQFSNVDTIKGISEWTVPYTCMAPQAVCSTIVIVVPGSSAAAGPGSSSASNEPEKTGTSSNTGAVLGGVFGALGGLLVLWIIYSVRAYGEVRIPCTERALCKSGGGGGSANRSGRDGLLDTQSGWRSME